MPCRITIRALLLLLCPNLLVQAYPSFFAYRSQGPQYAPCVAHPDQALGPHLAPIWDDTIVFNVVNSNGKPVTSWCPGRTYKIQVSWPDAPPAPASRPASPEPAPRPSPAEPSPSPSSAEPSPSPSPPLPADGSPSPNQTLPSPGMEMPGGPFNTTFNATGPDAMNSSTAGLAESMVNALASPSPAVGLPGQGGTGRRRLAELDTAQSTGGGPIGRYMLITATQGIFPKSAEQQCTHRQWFDYSNTPQPQPGYSDIVMKATCWASTDNYMVLKVTTCQGPGYHFRQAYVSVPAAKNCEPDPVLCPPSLQLRRQRSPPPPTRSFGATLRDAITGTVTEPERLGNAVAGVISDVITGIINDG